MRWAVRWHDKYRSVCWVPQEAEGCERDLCSGWYYVDGTWNLNGPYGTAEDANKASKTHAKGSL